MWWRVVLQRLRGMHGRPTLEYRPDAAQSDVSRHYRPGERHSPTPNAGPGRFSAHLAVAPTTGCRSRQCECQESPVRAAAIPQSSGTKAKIWLWIAPTRVDPGPRISCCDPTGSWASVRVTRAPARARCQAIEAPIMPAPTTSTCGRFIALPERSRTSLLRPTGDRLSRVAQSPRSRYPRPGSVFKTAR
jgi:hypothetical protein